MENTHKPADSKFPDYLQNFELLEQHFRAQLQHLSNVDKGSRFAQFVQRLIPQTELGSAYEQPALPPRKSWDEGVDLSCKGKDGKSVLYVQAKLWVDTAEDIDSILSKFEAYQTQHHLDENSTQYAMEFDPSRVSFAVVTLSSPNNS
jgi:hypothetical protein